MNLIMSQYSTTLEDDAMRNIIVLIFFFLSFFLTESVLQKLRSIVAMNENLKRQEQEFRAHCKVLKPSKGSFCLTFFGSSCLSILGCLWSKSQRPFEGSPSIHLLTRSQFALGCEVESPTDVKSIGQTV